MDAISTLKYISETITQTDATKSAASTFCLENYITPETNLMPTNSPKNDLLNAGEHEALEQNVADDTLNLNIETQPIIGATELDMRTLQFTSAVHDIERVMETSKLDTPPSYNDSLTQVDELSNEAKPLEIKDLQDHVRRTFAFNESSILLKEQDKTTLNATQQNSNTPIILEKDLSAKPLEKPVMLDLEANNHEQQIKNQQVSDQEQNTPSYTLKTDDAMASSAMHFTKTTRTATDTTHELITPSQEMDINVANRQLQPLKTQHTDTNPSELSVSHAEEAAVASNKHTGDAVQTNLQNILEKMDFSAITPKNSPQNMPTNLNQGEFRQTSGHQVSFTEVKQTLQSGDTRHEYTASIKIYPPELGEIEAKIMMRQGQASLTMTTDDSQVKQVVESSIHKLKESFTEANLNLVDVNVSERERQHQKHSSQHKNSAKPFQEMAGDQAMIANSERNTNAISHSLVDIYA